MIDIPGIGNVEAKNAATESTLREILKAMQGVQKNTGGGTRGGGAGGAGNSGAGGAGGGASSASKNQSLLARASQAAGASLSKMSSKVMPVVSGLGTLAEGLTKTISTFANVGDSVERAADALNFIPVLGGLFGAVAGASQKVNDAFLKAASGGASFGGSVTNLAKAASSAGMTLSDFAEVVRGNGVGMLGFGASTEEGAKRFAQVSKSLRTSSADLYALGYSTKDINEGLAKYGELLKLQGQQGKKSNTELVDGAKKYLKEIDQLAKITGEERSAKESQMKQLATDAQFRMFLAGKDEKVGEDFRKMVGSFGPKLGGFVKDYMATGTLTTEANQKLASMLGGDVMNEMTRLRQKLLNNQRLTDSEQDRLKTIMKKAADANAKIAGTALAADRGMDDASGGLIEAMSLETDAHKKTAQEQNKAAKEGDGFNKRMQEIQQRLAQFSNAFTMALANTGVLDFMMKMFTFLANLVQTIVVPAFTIMAGVISTLGSILLDFIVPVFDGLGKLLFDYLYPAFLDLAAFIIVDVIEPLKALGSQIMEYVSPALEWMGSVMQEYVTPVFEAIGDFIENNLQPIMLGLAAGISAVVGWYAIKNAILIAGTIAQGAFNLAVMAGGAAMALLTSPIFLVIAAIAGVVAVFKALYDKGWTLSSAWEAIKDNLSRFGMSITEFIDNMRTKLPSWLGGMSEEEAKVRKEERDAQRQELNLKEAARDAEREKVATERANSEDAKKRAKVAKELDSKILNQKNRYSSGIGKTAGKVEEANKKLDTGAGAETLLTQFAQKEGSPLLPPKEAAAKAESAKKEVEQKGQEKQAAEDKAKQEAEERKKAEDKAKEDSGKKQAPAQESAESLLAQLNSNMSQLIKITKDQRDLNEQQLSVQKGLTGNLFT